MMGEKNISRQQRWQRRLVRAGVHFILPADAVLDAGGLRRAESLARLGYGTLVLMNHFSLRDGLQVLHLVYGSEALRRRPTLAPAASQHLAGPLLPAVADAVGIRLLPITTIEAVQEQGLDPASGVNPLVYAREAIATLQAGGIVLLAPQAGRRPVLDELRLRPVSLLMAQARRQRLRNVALFFVGLGIAEQSDYSLDKVGGLNLGRRYEVRIGRTFTLDEALQRAGGLRGLDAWVYHELRHWVPAPYSRLPVPPGPHA